MKNYFLSIFTLVLIAVSCTKSNTSTTEIIPEDTFIRAADVSYLPLIESEGTIFKHNNQPEDVLVTLKNAGCNTIRIRLWKNPSDAHSGLAEVKTLSNRAKQLGMKVWLTVHFSDTWADPAHQATPVAWQSLSFTDLKTAATTYTSTILTEINPDIIQIGNETNDGFMYPNGQLSTNENQYLQLLQAISLTIRNQSPKTKIMLHYAGISGSDWFFSKVANINYDYIGLSYYPIWHGKSLTDLQNKINLLGQSYNKKVLIAETSYPFTLGWNDWTNNIVGLDNQIIPDFSATNDGQKNYLLAIKNLVKQSNYGQGFCYWEPEWVAFRGVQATNGSSWENQALWDFNNNSLPALDVFSKN